MASMSLTSLAASKNSLSRASWARRFSNRADRSTCSCVTSLVASDWNFTTPSFATAATNSS